MTNRSFIVAPLDSYAERVTSGIALLGGVLMLPALFSFLSGVRIPGVIIPVASAVALALWLTLNYAVQPIEYILAPGHLVIRRRWARQLKIPLKEINGVSIAATLADIPRFGLRRSFNAGVFGYQGPFHLETYGKVFFIATHRERLVAIARLGQSPLLLSPARPREFVEALREQLLEGVAHRQSAQVAGQTQQED